MKGISLHLPFTSVFAILLAVGTVHCVSPKAYMCETGQLVRGEKTASTVTAQLDTEDMELPSDAEHVKETVQTKVESANAELPFWTDHYTDLFYESGSGIYNYCPSLMINGSMIDTFYCSNVRDYTVSDHICYRTSMQSETGYFYSEKFNVLSPTDGAWDSVHVCDPSVVAGRFHYNGVTYKYLMAYLGCSQTDNQNNKIGLAVSNELNSGWVKCDNINPFIDFTYDTSHSDTFQWGVGQPSAINMDENGRILILYTRGTYNLTCEFAELYDLSDLNSPVKIGETVVNNVPDDFISNADFAISGNTIYMTCDSHPFRAGTLSNVADCSSVYAADIDVNDVIGSLSKCAWSRVYSVDASVSGHMRNHNTGLFRDEYGRLSGRSILYTAADDLGSFSDSLWTYRLKRADF